MPKLIAPAVKATEPARLGSYFLVGNTDDSKEYFSSGCTVVDCVLGGRGWRLGRMSNVIGDSSTSKTGLAIEAFANFALTFPRGDMLYREAESAFDKHYGSKMGMPRDVRFWDDDYKDRMLDTIEDVFEDLERIIAKRRRSPKPCLYVIDSLDSLTDREETKRKIDTPSYGQNKAKKIGEMFRRLVREIEASRMTLLIVSQVRDNIGVMFGEKHKRTGGKAMDFYASHCLWLSRKAVVKGKVGSVERATGIIVQAFLKKNKLGLPLRKAQFHYKFGWGIDDIESSLEWLKSAGLLKKSLGVDTPQEFLSRINVLPREERGQMNADLSTIVREAWTSIDDQLLPVEGKYQNNG